LFHSQAWHRKRTNFIAKLQSGNQAATSHEEKAETLQKIYEGLIGTREQRDQTIDLDAIEIQQHDLHMLESPISEE
jgi:effector-binding domain-containing protein